MAVNKVVLGAVSIIDISDSTITEETMVEGSTGYGANGEKLVGTNPYRKEETTQEVNAQGTLIGQILEELEGKASNSGGITPTGTVQIKENGTHDVTNYASAKVEVPVGVFPSGTKEITENGTHDVTNFENANVHVPVGVFPSGTKEITSNGTHEVTEFASVNVNVQSGISLPTTIKAGNTPVLSSATMAHTCTATTATATGISITVPRAGTYRFKFSCARTNTSGNWTAQLRKNGTAINGATATWSQYQGSCTADVQCNANDKIEIYSQSRGTQYRLITGQLVACIDLDLGL